MSQAFADAQRALENPVPSPATLSCAVALLDRAGISRAQIDHWAYEMNKSYGLMSDPRALSLAVNHGLALSRQGASLQRAADEPVHKQSTYTPLPPVSVPMPAAGMFRDAEHMLAVCVDAAGVRTRLKQLKSAVDEVSTARAKLEVERGKFADHVAKTTAELDAREAAVRERVRKVYLKETEIAADVERVAPWHQREHANDLEVVGPSGITRDLRRHA